MKDPIDQRFDQWLATKRGKAVRSQYESWSEAHWIDDFLRSAFAAGWHQGWKDAPSDDY